MTWPGFGSGHDCGYLFDPLTMPRVHARANAVMHHLQPSHDLEYIDRRPPSSPPYDLNDPNQQAAMFVHFVNEPDTLYVFRDRAGMFRWLWMTVWPADRCRIHDAAACTGDGVYTVFVPVQRGQVLVFFEACLPCYEHLHDVALGGDILAEADARVAAEAVAEQQVAKWRAIRAAQDGQTDG
jgi:hypothetical protein